MLRKYPGPHNNCNLDSRKTQPKPTAEETTKKPIEVSTTAAAKPSKHTTTTSKPTTYEGEDAEEEVPDLYDEEDEECTNGEFYPNPHACDKYYICDHDRKIERL